jgi:hypothetical protein
LPLAHHQQVAFAPLSEVDQRVGGQLDRIQAFLKLIDKRRCGSRRLTVKFTWPWRAGGDPYDQASEHQEEEQEDTLPHELPFLLAGWLA